MISVSQWDCFGGVKVSSVRELDFTHQLGIHIWEAVILSIVYPLCCMSMQVSKMHILVLHVRFHATIAVCMVLHVHAGDIVYMPCVT